MPIPAAAAASDVHLSGHRLRCDGAAGGGLVMFIVELLLLVLVIAGAIALLRGTRKVPVQYAKRIVGNKQYGGVRQYIPLKMNAANVEKFNVEGKDGMRNYLEIPSSRLSEGGYLDPWGNEYEYTIEDIEEEELPEEVYQIAVSFPNVEKFYYKDDKGK